MENLYLVCNVLMYLLLGLANASVRDSMRERGKTPHRFTVMTGYCFYLMFVFTLLIVLKRNQGW